MAQEYQPKNKGTKQLFKNPILEKLTRTHISVPLVIFGLYSAALLYWSMTRTTITIGTTVGLFGLGFLAFTLFEYLMHRFIFHMGTYTRIRAKVQYMIHGVHHEFPRDKQRLAMPPVLSITIATTLLILFQFLMYQIALSSQHRFCNPSYHSRIHLQLIQ